MQIDALRRALEESPENQALRLILYRELVAASRHEEALAEARILLDHDALPDDCLLEAGNLAVDLEQSALAEDLLTAVLDRLGGEPVEELRGRVEDLRDDHGVLRLVPAGGGGGEEPESEEEPAEAAPSEVTFEDVGGLEEVKKAVHRMLILPLTRPGLLRKYGRRSGGGVLLYGPPGCGKTLVAYATAGECRLPLFELRINQILSKWLGESEQNVSDIFTRARDRAPSVVFIDELDALAFARRKQVSEHSRGLVDTLLKEVDDLGKREDQVLVLGATNAPWDVDDAFKRPGRFDRVLFVPPPDERGREAILERLLAKRETEKINLRQLTERTPLWSGADLLGMVEDAVDLVIEEALDTGTEPPLRMEHLTEAAELRRPSTLEWLSRARNYVEYANRSERYRDVARYLKKKKVRKHL